MVHTSMYLYVLRMYSYVLDTDKYIQVHTWCVPSPVLQDFVEFCVMQTRGSSSRLQIRTLTRVVTKIPAWRMKNVKTVANLTNYKDVFMCILRFHARDGYLQTYENLLKEINLHPGSVAVPDDQYHVERVALADCNFNLACETGIRYPSLVAMLNRRAMLWRASVIFDDMHVYTCMN
jgi:hypothetical protein